MLSLLIKVLLPGAVCCFKNPFAIFFAKGFHKLKSSYRSAATTATGRTRTAATGRAAA
jgi:hypothetical protein